MSIELAAGAEVPTTPAEAIELAGSGRSQAYSMLGRLRAGVETLARPAGRPAEPKADDDKLLKLAKSVISFLKGHPGCCTDSGGRAFYHDDFRRFVVDLFAPGGLAVDISVGQVADAIELPLGTLKDWLHAALAAPASTDSAEHQDSPTEPIFSTTQPQIATLLVEYANWKGTMSGFCEYASSELGLPFGRGFITTVLTAAGLHTPKPRSHPHQAPWSRGATRRDFPGMQWFGDGKQLTIVLRGQRFTFNLEAFVDGATTATVGAIVSTIDPAMSPPRSSKPCRAASCCTLHRDAHRPKPPSREPSACSSRCFPARWSWWATTMRISPHRSPSSPYEPSFLAETADHRADSVVARQRTST